MNDLPHCEHRSKGLCQISTQLAGIPVKAAADACQVCSNLPNPHCDNHVTRSKAIYTLYLTKSEIPPNLRQGVHHNPAAEPINKGPGTELEKLISWFKSSSDSCGCRDKVQKMNRWGPDKCETNIDLIKKWLRESAAKENIPYIDFIATVLIKKAIKNARAKMGSSNHNSSA